LARTARRRSDTGGTRAQTYAGEGYTKRESLTRPKRHRNRPARQKARLVGIWGAAVGVNRTMKTTRATVSAVWAAVKVPWVAETLSRRGRWGRGQYRDMYV